MPRPTRIRFRPVLRSLEDRRTPATFTVTSLNDSGGGSLRQAIIDANSNGTGLDTVNFNIPNGGTITLAGEIAVTGSVVIQGPSNLNITVSGNSAVRILNVGNASATLDVSLNSVVLTKAKAASPGGAIFNDGENLAINGCQITNNTATFGGGLSMKGSGKLSINNCNFSGNSATAGNGGAIDSGTGITGTIENSSFGGNTASGSGGAFGLANANLTFNNVTITGNTAGGNGGGVLSFFNTLTFNNSTLVNNKAGIDGGGLWQSIGSLTFNNSTATGNKGGQGGGFYVTGKPAALAFRNATVSSNSAADGGGFRLLNCDTPLVLQNSTVTNNTASVNGGGINRFGGTGTISLESTILSGNTDTGNDSPDLENKYTTTSFKNSVIGSAAGLGQPSNLGGNLAFGTNIQLGPLSNSGGLTLTHRPLAGSPLINAGSNPANLTTDQRGFARVSGPAADIGSVEVQSSLVVTNTNDSGSGSLRDALFASNADPGPATITFDPAVFAKAQTINLPGGVLSISDAVTISGPANVGVTVKNTKAGSRVFDTTGALGQTAINLVRLTITGGSTGEGGGGILISDESVTLTNSTVTGNTAAKEGGGIYLGQATGRLILNGSVVSNNTSSEDGGGITVRGASSITVTNSTLSGNKAANDGGAIYFNNGGSLLLENSTVSGNQATAGIGGGFYFFGTPGAAGLVVRQSTFSGNSSGGSGGGIVLASFDGTLTVQNSTVVNNTSGAGGGGIARVSGGGTIALESSVVAGNVNASAPDIFSGGTVNAKSSAVGSNTGFTRTDLGGNLAFGIDLKLGPLQNNGGQTLTHFAAGGSPLIDAGTNPANLTFDQRGDFRVIGAAADIGAAEGRYTVVLNTGNAGPGSLRQAVQHATSNPGGFTVTFDPTAFASSQTITLTSGEIAFTNGVTVNGPFAKVTLNGNNKSRIFNQANALPNAKVTLNNLTFTGGKTDQSGAAVLAGDEFLTLTNCLFVNNNAGGNGGAVAFVEAGPGTLTVSDCTFTTNTAGGNGGAIYSEADSVTVTNSVFTSNKAAADGNGGGVVMDNGGSLTVRNSAINANTAGNGGGVWMGEGGSLLIENSALIGNGVTSYGGALVYNGVVGPGGAAVRNVTIANNTSSVFAGGLGLGFLTGTFNIQNSTVTGNSAATGNGGGMAIYGGTGKVAVESSVVAQNTSPEGPDIHNTGGFPLTIRNSAIGNAADFTFTNLGNNLPFGTDLKLGPLQNNGGATQTRLPQPGSPLINAGSNPAGLSTDQRGPGYGRQRDGAIDIGAVEAGSAFILVLFEGGFLWQRAGDTWTGVTSNVKSVSDAATDAAGRSVYTILYTNGNLSEYRSDGTLTPLSSGVTAAEPSPTATYVTFTAGGLWRRERSSGMWTNLTGAVVTSVSVGGDTIGQDLVGVIFSGGFAWTYQNLGGAAEWKNVAGSVAQMSVGPVGTIGVLFNGGFLWQHRPAAAEWISLGSNVASVNAGTGVNGGRQFNVLFNGGFAWAYTDAGWSSLASNVSRMGRPNGALFTVLFNGGFLWLRDSAGWVSLASGVI